ncbi:MAG: ABC transporter substrate-binding protein [Christensenellales bacterium]|jgi:raffinose/stachyose/melibiose transport system substrate-binding protein
MKKSLAILLLASMLLALIPATFAEESVLTMGSWRNEDTEQVQALLDKYKEISGVSIRFEPTRNTEYNANLRLQLEAGTGPDLFYARSYTVGRQLYDDGYAMDVTDIPGVMENFDDVARHAWTAEDGKVFAVPFAAVNHVVYYDKDVFEKYELEVPKTFEELLQVCETLKENDVTPLANGLAENWDILECVFCGMVPNYIGGFENREKYESGERKLNDEHFLAALTDFEKLTKYFPEGFQSVANADGPMLLALGRAAMFIDGSWRSGAWDKDFPEFNWGAFAIPAPEGNEQAICHHSDMGITGNNATKHPEEVKAFLEWLASPEGAQIVTDYLPKGYFPMINADVKLADEKTAALKALSDDKIRDSRFMWNKLFELYTPLVDQLNAIANGTTTVQEAADFLAEEQAKVLGK